MNFITCALKRDAQVVLCKGFYFFGISHSPRTPLGHAHRWSNCKHYVDKLQTFSPNCHNIFILTMPTALGRRSGAVYGDKWPKTRLVRIYCYGNTLYIVNLITWLAMRVAHCIKRLPPIPFSPGSNLSGDCFFFFNFLFFLIFFFF